MCAHLPRQALGGSGIWCLSCHLPAGFPGHLVTVLLCTSFCLSVKWESCCSQDFPAGSDSEESTCNELGSIPVFGRSPGGGCGNPLQYSGLENPMDRGARRVTYSPWGHKESDTTERPSRGVDQVVPKPREVPGPRGSCQHRDTQAKSAKRPPYTPSLSLSDLADHLTGCGLLSVSWPGRQTLVSPFYRRDVLQRPRGHLRESHQVADSAGLIGNPFHAPRSFVTWGSEAGVCQPRVGPWDPSGQPLPHPFPSAWAHP